MFVFIHGSNRAVIFGPGGSVPAEISIRAVTYGYGYMVIFIQQVHIELITVSISEAWYR